MEGEQIKTFIGIAMIALGLIQAGSFVVQENLMFSIWGLAYAGLGVTFLWTEVYSTA